MAQKKREPYNPLLKSYPDSEKINAVSEGAEVLYIRLLAQADDDDNYFGDPAMVLGKLFTQRMCAGQLKVDDISDRISELSKVELIATYSAGGKQYIHIINRKNNLRSDGAIDIRFPIYGKNNSVPKPSRKRTRPGPLPYPTHPNPTLPIPSHPPENGPVVTDPYSDAMLKFWSAFPQRPRSRSTRDEVWKLWVKLKLEPLAAQIMEALDKWKAMPDWVKDSGQFAPAIDRWVRDGFWKDAPANGRDHGEAHVSKDRDW